MFAWGASFDDSVRERMTDNVNAAVTVPSDSVHFDEIDVILRKADMAAKRPVSGHFRRVGPADPLAGSRRRRYKPRTSFPQHFQG
ncbi:MAG: hypothetical protein J0G95_14260 [Rhizobiales bacterium]|nr:hypothetical protein [Hyphomicrobiales bacterium]